MVDSVMTLTFAAASIGLLHTLFGPDHYLPFIMMSRSGNWSIRKTSLITFICGLGHVLGSIVLGFLGIVFGIAVSSLEVFEGFRGNIAAWVLITFGLIYMIWGIKKAIRDTKHGHSHGHLKVSEKKKMTPWILFVIFVLGPCEPLIPMLMYPAYEHNFTGVVLVAFVFSLATITTMMAMVIYASIGLRRIKFGALEPYTHAMAGGIILLSGLGIQFLGL